MVCITEEIKISEKYTYQDLIQELQIRTGYSYFRVRTILKELSRLLQKKVKQGIAIDCEGICKIDFSIKGYTNMNRTYYSVQEQAKDLSESLKLEKIDMLNLIRNYYNLIKTKIEQGYQVNIKSICRVDPIENLTGDIYINTRMSPQLKKPEIAEFVVLDRDGRISTKIFDKNIRLNMFLDENLKLPNRIVSKETYEAEYINFN